MNDKEKQTLLGDALLKKAIGYDTSEVIEEFSENDGQVVLVKKKVTKKRVPPDMTALKMLLDGESRADVTTMTEEELKAERNRLLKELANDLKTDKEAEQGDLEEQNEAEDGTEEKD